MITMEFNDGEARLVLAQIEAALTDMTPLMRDLGDMLVQSTQDRMLRGEQPDGTSFAPRSAVTLARYAKLGLSYGAPLNQSGEMRGQIAFDAGADYVEVGSNAIQAAVMQFGAAQGEFGASIGKDKLGRDHFHTIPWGDIPARPFIGLSDEDQTNIVAEVEKWLERAAGSGA